MEETRPSPVVLLSSFELLRFSVNSLSREFSDLVLFFVSVRSSFVLTLPSSRSSVNNSSLSESVRLLWICLPTSTCSSQLQFSISLESRSLQDDGLNSFFK